VAFLLLKQSVVLTRIPPIALPFLAFFTDIICNLRSQAEYPGIIYQFIRILLGKICNS
jgi:hypothetical protein